MKHGGSSTRNLLFLFVSVTALLHAQTGIVGDAPIALEAGPLDCRASCPTVDVFVDVTGLEGMGGQAGLNAFVLAFTVSRPGVYAWTAPGSDPDLNWSFVSTRRDLVGANDTLVLVGAVGDEAAPNQRYQVARLILCGDPGSVTLTFDPASSSLGSRVVGGDGPGPIGFQAPQPFTIDLTPGLALDFLMGVDAWLSETDTFDLAEPLGQIDVLDLVKMVNCGQFNS